MAVPGHFIGEALRGVTVLNGQVTIDVTNFYTGFPSRAPQVTSVVGGPTAKAFNTVSASACDLIGERCVTPCNLPRGEPDARNVTAAHRRRRLRPPACGRSGSGSARLLESSCGLKRVLTGQISPFLYRCGRPGEL
ncbi:dinucleotide-binding protein [Streptomyces sp. NPDC002306]